MESKVWGVVMRIFLVSGDKFKDGKSTKAGGIADP